LGALNRDLPPVACVSRPVPHQVKAMSSIAKALRERGINVRETYDRIPPEGVVFAWSWKWCKEILQKHPSAIVCTLDHGLFHPRNATTVTGWMGLNGHGEHPRVLDGGKRLDKSLLRPWRPASKRALILGQCFNDVQILDHLEDYGQWLRDRGEALQREGYEVHFRPHPVQRRNDLDRYPRFAPITNGHTVFDDIEQLGIGRVEGFNSNALLDSYMYGVPDVRVYNQGSMLWPVVDIETGKADTTRREPLAEMLAWCQWTTDEIASGVWADYHIPIMRRLLEQTPRALRPWHATEVRYTPQPGQEG
jgi:hypothetical protein